MIDDLFKEYPLDLFEILILGPLTSVYLKKKQAKIADWLNYSNLIVDKYAIHSSSFFHLSKGIIEHKKSGEQIKMNGYDLFTVNAIFRTIMETYATHYHIFVEPKTNEEKKFRFLLWKIDGLFDKRNFDIQETDFEEAKNILENDNELLEITINEFETCDFFKEIPKDQLSKIYNTSKERYNWRFLFSNYNIIVLNITKFIKHIFKIRAFTNAYKYASIHTHSNYLAIENFEKLRGKVIAENQTDPITRLAIIITCMLIDDLCKIDTEAKIELDSFPVEIKNFIQGISNNIKNKQSPLATN